MVNEYDLIRPPVGEYGLKYAEEVRKIQKGGSTPQFMCHYYNWYFAHTAGGIMIGKKISNLLLDGRTLDFYKWNKLSAVKAQVKENIENMAESWTREEKDMCVNETGPAFQFGGGINYYISH